MDLRFGVESDLPALLSLVNQAFMVENFFKTADRLDEQSAREYFSKGRFLVADEDGALVGCIFVQVHGQKAYLGLLSVAPGRQKNGLGRRLVAAAEEFSREMGAHHMELTVVNLRTELLPIYQRLGYQEVGTEPIPEQMAQRVNQPCHFIRMTKPLGNG